MTGGQKAASAAAIVIVLAIGAGVWITLPPRPTPTISLEGAVLRQDTDPRRQTPIENVIITATLNSATTEVKSDSSGFFRLTLHPAGKWQDLPLILTFDHPGYQSVKLTEAASAGICIARMIPLFATATIARNAPNVAIGNVRLRYTIQASVTMSVGSVARTFEVNNTGGVRCNGRSPCSPGGKWKAATGSISLDAGAENEFIDVRSSCIAGPCPFTKIESTQSGNHGRTLKVTALDWSDSTTFLVEAEVTHVMMSDLVRESYPVIFGNAMNFTLPGSAEGPSVEADVNGAPIVFPLGPDLWLSWASCTVKIDADRSRLYRCELKPGYRFQ